MTCESDSQHSRVSMHKRSGLLHGSVTAPPSSCSSTISTYESSTYESSPPTLANNSDPYNSIPHAAISHASKHEETAQPQVQGLPMSRGITRVSEGRGVLELHRPRAAGSRCREPHEQSPATITSVRLQ